MSQFHKKVPFSFKKKKAQLKQKKLVNSDPAREDGASSSTSTVVKESAGDRYTSFTRQVVSINRQPQQNGRDNRFNLEFSRAKLDAEYERSKTEMHEEIDTAAPETLEYCSQDFFPDGLTFPQRPQGYQTMTKDELAMLETRSVRLYGEEMDKLFAEGDINLYEQNVETWKQLWRVFDKSHVLLFIVDIRFAVCQFAPYVYKRLSEEKRGVVLVLNKVDLVPASLVLAWKQYFMQLCPGIQVVPFCSHENMSDRVRKTRLAYNSCRNLITAVEAVAPIQVDLSSWKQQLKEATLSFYEDAVTVQTQGEDDQHFLQHKQMKLLRGKQKKKAKHKRRAKLQEKYSDESEEDEEVASLEESVNKATSLEEAEVGSSCMKDMSRPFTIGTIGYPNVGKSSLINAILGRNMVSVSRTPGHTKHFQTHFLTPSRDILLCDCPGLIFPAVCPYKLQVLSGTFPVSQVRAPMSVLGFMASHINVPRVLGLKFPVEYKDNNNTTAAAQWTPFIIAEAWAAKRNYHVRGKGGRLDCSRSANELLRLSLVAKNKLVLALRPKGYAINKHNFECDAETETIRMIQGVHAEEAAVQEKVLSFQHISRGTKLGWATTALHGEEGAAAPRSQDEHLSSCDDSDHHSYDEHSSNEDE